MPHQSRVKPNAFVVSETQRSEVGFHYVLACIWQPLGFQVCLGPDIYPLTAVQPNLREHENPKLTPIVRCRKPQPTNYAFLYVFGHTRCG